MWDGTRAILGGRPVRNALKLAHALRRHGFSLGSVLIAAEKRFGTREALVDNNRRYTYVELGRMQRRAAAQLRRAGAKSGTCVVIALRDRAELLAAAGAAGLLDCRTVLADPRTPPGQWPAIVHRERADLLLGDSEEVLDAAGLTSATPFLGRLHLAHLPPPATGTGAARRRGLVLLTSGSTGQPKGVATRQAPGQVRTMVGLLGASGIGRGPVLVLPPLFHGQGLSMATAALLCGAPLVVSGVVDHHRETGTNPNPAPSQALHASRGTASGKPSRAARRGLAILRCAAAEGATVIGAVPAHLEFIAAALQAGGDRPPTLRRIVTGGDQLRPATARALTAKLGPVVTNLYGTTEGGTATVALPSDVAAHPHSVGRPVPGVRIDIVNGRGSVVDRGAVGRIRVTSPMAAHGYTSASLRPRNARHRPVVTSDAGYIDAAGLLHIRGRLDGLANTGAEIVDPASVERALSALPQVSWASVEVMPDDVLGQRLIATVRLHPGTTWDAQAMEAHLRRTLPRAAVPTEIRVL